MENSTVREILNRLDRLSAIEQRLAAIEEQLRGTRKDYLSIRELADLFGRSEYTIRRWIKVNKLQALRVEGTGPRGRLLVHRAEVDKLIGLGMHPSGTFVPTDTVEEHHASAPAPQS